MVLVLMLVQVRVLMLVVVQLLAQVGWPGWDRRQPAAIQKPVVQLAPQHIGLVGHFR